MSILIRNRKPYLLIVFACLFFLGGAAQDSATIKVQFIYASKPLKRYKHAEPKWFGGMYGGHAGIEIDSNRFLSFEGRGKFHVFNHRKNRHSVFKFLPATEFWNIMGSPGDSVKKLTVIIPLSSLQKQKCDSIAASYHQHTPYDYSLFGMRCASSTYEILAQLGLLKRHSFTGTSLKIFYPRVLRKKMIRAARRNRWIMIQKKGTARRKWERI